MHILGIDPGKQGALACLNDDGTLVDVWDMPLVAGSLDLSALYQLLEQVEAFRLTPPFAIIEAQRGSGQQGCVSAFTTGYGYGALLACLTALRLPYDLVFPHIWKRHYGLIGPRKDKDFSRQRAQQLYPGAALHLKKHEGRAEALLIARYGWQRFSFQPKAERLQC